MAVDEVMVGSEEVFPAELRSVPAARQFAAHVLQDAPIDIYDVLLLVSELAANAVVHARTPFVLRVQAESLPLRVELQDYSPEPPVLRRPELEAPSGRGMLLIDQLSSSWGVTPWEGGKRVWFEYDGCPTA